MSKCYSLVGGTSSSQYISSRLHISPASSFSGTQQNQGKSHRGTAHSTEPTGPTGQRALNFGLSSPFPATSKHCEPVCPLECYRLDDSSKMIWPYSHRFGEIILLWHLLQRMNHTCKNRQPFRCVKWNTKRVILESSGRKEIWLQTKPLICSVTYSPPLLQKGQSF